MDCEDVWKWLAQASPTNHAGQARVFSPDSPFAHFNPSAAFVDVSFSPQVPQSPDVKPPKHTNVYERKPRHKTTESRYEYKGQGQQQPANRSRKMRKQARKHTLNETFRAANVVPARLTFTTRLNPRVSNQAQSSSSVQPCKFDLSSPEPESLPKRAELEEVNEVKDSKSVDQQHKSRSATPFTWLQEAAESPAPQRQSETCAKGALCADLGHQHISDEEKASKRYWDLGELKLILRLRREIETGRGIAFYRDYLKRERAASEIDEAFASLAEVQTGSSTPIEGIEDHHGDLERALGSDMGLMSKIQTGSSTPIRFRKDHPGGLERALGSETWLNPEDETAPLGYTPDVSTCAGYLGDHAHGQPQDGAYGAPLGMLTGPQWRLHGNGYRGSMRRVGALDLLDELVQDPFAGLPIDKAEGCSRRNSLY